MKESKNNQQSVCDVKFNDAKSGVFLEKITLKESF